MRRRGPTHSLVSVGTTDENPAASTRRKQGSSVLCLDLRGTIGKAAARAWGLAGWRGAGQLPRGGARREVPEEADFSVVPESRAEQVDHHGHYEDGHEHRTRMGLETEFYGLYRSGSPGPSPKVTLSTCLGGVTLVP